MSAIKQSFTYQLRDNRKALLIYWGAMFFMTITQFILLLYPGRIQAAEDTAVLLTSSGYSLVSTFTLFIFGLNWHKPYLGYLVQNGFSRKTVFAGHLLSAAVVSALVSLVDVIFTFFSKGIARLFEDVDYLLLFDAAPLEILYSREWNLSTALLSVVFGFALILSSSSLGYLLSALYYRMNTAGKIAFSIAFPVGLFILLPLTDHYLLDGRAAGFIGRLFTELVLPTPAGLTLFLLVSAALFTLLAWPLVRRAPIKASFAG